MASPHEKALQSDVPPKNKSDSQWLHDMGYRGGIYEFQIAYGISRDDKDEAQRLVEQFRAEQQEEWEARRKLSTSTADKPTLSAAKKQELVQEAMLWHRCMGHASYPSILKLPKSATCGFEGLEVRDLPDCEICTQVGSDPYTWGE